MSLSKLEKMLVDLKSEIFVENLEVDEVKVLRDKQHDDNYEVNDYSDTLQNTVRVVKSENSASNESGDVLEVSTSIKMLVSKLLQKMKMMNVTVYEDYEIQVSSSEEFLVPKVETVEDVPEASAVPEEVHEVLGEQQGSFPPPRS